MMADRGLSLNPEKCQDCAGSAGPLAGPETTMPGSIHPLVLSHPADIPFSPQDPPQERCSPDGANILSSANSDHPQRSNADLAPLPLRLDTNHSTAGTPFPTPDGAVAELRTTTTTTATTATTTIRNADPDPESPPSQPVAGASLTLDSHSLWNANQPPETASASGHGHRKNALSIESVPRQTIMKALASVARSNKPQALSLNGMLSVQSVPKGADNPPGSSSSQQLCDALNGIAQAQISRPNASATPTAAFPSLQSPCFYHTRFDDAVDIDKVLEEIKHENWMSHSRLVQTATGVREVSKQLRRRPIRRAVRNVMIVTKARDNHLVVLTRELAAWLLQTPRYGSDVGVNVYVDAKLRHSKRFNARGIMDQNPRFQDMLKYWTPDLCWSQPEKFDLVLTLGGDGTVLFTSWLFQRIVPPVLSFSLGSLGFMTSFEFERYKDHLNRVMGEDGMRVNLRMRFTCTVYRHGSKGHEVEEGEQFEVLNELVIDRGPSPYVSNLELYGDDELLTVVQADGCIFSTPTGKFPYPALYPLSPSTDPPTRIHRLLPLRGRRARPSGHTRHPPHPNLPAHPVLPAHGPLRHDAPARVGPAQQPRHGLLRLRRQGPHRAQAGRPCHHHGVAVPLPDRRPRRHGVVRQRLAHP